MICNTHLLSITAPLFFVFLFLISEINAQENTVSSGGDGGDYISYTIQNCTKINTTKQGKGKVSVGLVQVGGNNCGLKK